MYYIYFENMGEDQLNDEEKNTRSDYFSTCHDLIAYPA